jgi:hypothetical protein
MTDTSKSPSSSGGTVEFGRDVDAARTRGAALVPPLNAYIAWACDFAEAVLDVLPAAGLRWRGGADDWTFLVHVHGDPLVSFDSDTGWYEGDGSIWSGVIRGAPAEMGRLIAENYAERRA